MGSTIDRSSCSGFLVFHSFHNPVGCPLQSIAFLVYIGSKGFVAEGSIYLIVKPHLLLFEVLGPEPCAIKSACREKSPALSVFL